MFLDTILSKSNRKESISFATRTDTKSLTLSHLFSPSFSHPTPPPLSQTIIGTCECWRTVMSVYMYMSTCLSASFVRISNIEQCSKLEIFERLFLLLFPTKVDTLSLRPEVDVYTRLRMFFPLSSQTKRKFEVRRRKISNSKLIFADECVT